MEENKEKKLNKKEVKISLGCLGFMLLVFIVLVLAAALNSNNEEYSSTNSSYQSSVSDNGSTSGTINENPLKAELTPEQKKSITYKAGLGDCLKLIADAWSINTEEFESPNDPGEKTYNIRSSDGATLTIETGGLRGFGTPARAGFLTVQLDKGLLYDDNFIKYLGNFIPTDSVLKKAYFRDTLTINGQSVPDKKNILVLHSKKLSQLSGINNAFIYERQPQSIGTFFVSVEYSPQNPNQISLFKIYLGNPNSADLTEMQEAKI